MWMLKDPRLGRSTLRNNLRGMALNNFLLKFNSLVSLVLYCSLITLYDDVNHGQFCLIKQPRPESTYSITMGRGSHETYLTCHRGPRRVNTRFC